MSSTSHLCDPIPPPQNLASSNQPPTPTPSPPPLPRPAFDVLLHDEVATSSPDNAEDHSVLTPIPPQPGRKLCVRHQRMADEGTSQKLQAVCLLVCHPEMQLLTAHIVTRRTPHEGKRGCQHDLVHVQLVFPSPSSPHPPGHSDHVLLLSAFPPHRTTTPSHSSGSILRLASRGIITNPEESRRHLPRTGCPGVPALEKFGR